MSRLRCLQVTRPEVAVVVVTVAIVAGVLFEWPHWTESSAQCCHLCGNRRNIVHHDRWYRKTGEITEYRHTDFPVPPRHVHDWWQYGHGKVSPTGGYARSTSTRYCDGRQTWQPPDLSPENHLE